MKTSIFVLLASLLVAVGSWGSGFENWDAIKETQNVFSLVGIVGGVFAAWIGRSPVFNKGGIAPLLGNQKK